MTAQLNDNEPFSFTRDLIIFRRRLGAVVHSEVASELVQQICIGKVSPEPLFGKLIFTCLYVLLLIWNVLRKAQKFTVKSS